MNALMYHDVVPAGAEDTSGFPGRDAALYKITPEQFSSHLDAIARIARPAPPSSPARPTQPVFTFDDGGASAMRAADMLEARGLVGHFFVTANYVGAPGFLTVTDIRDLARRGHAIGSHSCSHPLRIGHCSWPRLVDEWTRSCAILGAIVGGEVRIGSVPGGDFAPRVAEAAAGAGITTLFTSEPTREPRTAFGLLLRGRFTIRKGTSAATAASLAAGDWIPCARQAALWSAMKVTKRLGGERYLRLRKLLLRHGDDVQWGDRIRS
jgi:peptidoglycan/xylan/chitin deacetylase (PgdA/CDA1 family)